MVRALRSGSVPTPVADYALTHAVTLDEAVLRSAAAAQIRARVEQLGDVPRWTTVGRLNDDAIDADVALLCGFGAGLLRDGAEARIRAHAAFLAVMFLAGPAGRVDWSASPLGVLCRRALAVHART